MSQVDSTIRLQLKPHSIIIFLSPFAVGAKSHKNNVEDEEDNEGDNGHLWGRKRSRDATQAYWSHCPIVLCKGSQNRNSWATEVGFHEKSYEIFSPQRHNNKNNHWNINILNEYLQHLPWRHPKLCQTNVLLILIHNLAKMSLIRYSWLTLCPAWLPCCSVTSCCQSFSCDNSELCVNHGRQTTKGGAHFIGVLASPGEVLAQAHFFFFFF